MSISLRAPLALLAALFLGGASALAAEIEKPNLIFIMVDDLGTEWVSCYGATDIKTPVIDELAATGMRFTNAYSMPKCTPTRAALLTGQYPFRNGWVNHWDVPRWGSGCHFDPKHNVTIGRVMKSAGYMTAIAGKWQINDFRVQPKILKEHGFDEWCMWTGYESGNSPSGKRYWNAYVHTNAGSKTYQDKFGPDVYTDFIVDFLGRHKDKPMMVYFPMALTHGPFTTTPHAKDAKSNIEKHKAMVLYTDHLVGRIVKALDDLDIRKRTILIFTTDNGTGGGVRGHLGEKLVRGGKGQMSEAGCHEPYVVNGPGLVPAGVVSDCLTDFTDLLPTFAELGGARLPEGVTLDGKSIAPVLLGQAKDGPREWIMAMGGGVAKYVNNRVVPAKPYAPRVIRDKRYKLWINEKGETIKVYDLKSDPFEEKNLLSSDDAELTAARKKLEAAVATFPEKDGTPRYDALAPQPWDKARPSGGPKPKKKRDRKKRKEKKL
jgi:arylsulfatase A-like enzyme